MVAPRAPIRIRRGAARARCLCTSQDGLRRPRFAGVESISARGIGPASGRPYRQARCCVSLGSGEVDGRWPLGRPPQLLWPRLRCRRCGARVGRLADLISSSAPCGGPGCGPWSHRADEPPALVCDPGRAAVELGWKTADQIWTRSCVTPGPRPTWRRRPGSHRVDHADPSSSCSGPRSTMIDRGSAVSSSPA